MNELLAPVEIEFELTNAENAEALRWHVVNTGGFRATAPLGVAAAAMLTGAMRFNGWPWFESIAVGAGALVLSVLLVTYAFPWLAALRSPQLTQHYAFRFTRRNVRFVSEQQEGFLEWERYDSWMQTPDFYLLYYDGDQFTVVPRRALETPEKEERFTNLLKARIGSRAN